MMDAAPPTPATGLFAGPEPLTWDTLAELGLPRDQRAYTIRALAPQQQVDADGAAYTQYYASVALTHPDDAAVGDIVTEAALTGGMYTHFLWADGPDHEHWLFEWSSAGWRRVR